MSDISKSRFKSRNARHVRIRKKISGSELRPRLCVRRTLKNIIAQIIDDASGKSIIQLTTNGKEFQQKFGELPKVKQSEELGKMIAEKAKVLGVSSIVFDRGGYIFHGRVKAVADGARSAGLQF